MKNAKSILRANEIPERVQVVLSEAPAANECLLGRPLTNVLSLGVVAYLTFAG